MESGLLHQQIAAMRQSFFNEEILDEQQFSLLEQLQGRGNPNFVESVFATFFTDSTPLLQNVEQALMEKNVPVKVDKMLHKLKGSSNSIGAKKVRNETLKTRKLIEEGNLEGVKAAFQEVQKEYDNLKTQLELYFQQLRQVDVIETPSRPK